MPIAFARRLLFSPSLMVGALLGLASLLGACSGGKSAFTQSGQGSYYADKFEGRKTASGTRYRANKLTAAHNTLPFGTVIRVTNQRTHRSVKVRVTDRGPHAKGRIVGSSRVDLQACKLEYSIVSPK